MCVLYLPLGKRIEDRQCLCGGQGIVRTEAACPIAGNDAFFLRPADGCAIGRVRSHIHKSRGLSRRGQDTIKALNTEYAELLAEKKAAYADYRKACEEMKELLTAKANIDRILELDKEQEEANERREKEAEQR